MTRVPLVLMLIGSAWCTALLAEEPAVSSRRVLASPQRSLAYTNSYALIIGINYRDRVLYDLRDKLALPPLSNAEDDAKAIHQLLTAHYGYRKENVRLLIGAEAKEDAIDREIGRLVDEQIVGLEDSVLLFFAGHGFQLKGEQRDRAAIFPYDIVLSGGKPTANSVRLYSDLVLRLKQSPARHKLVILDSCYSGEILKSGFYSASERDDRNSPELFKERGFQAIASCRANEVSSDGPKVNSPFTAALKKGLEHLPARKSFKSGFGTTRLFAYLHPELKGQSDDQEPQFGMLEGDGEFRFFPGNDESSREFFDSLVPSLGEQKLLQAAVTSSEGNWWFAERPWFIPSLRKQILMKVTGNRSAEDELIGRDTLRELTRNVIKAGLKDAAAEARTAIDPQTADGKPETQSLRQRRYQHAQQLLDGEGTPSLKEVLSEIADELDELQKREELEAADLHLLAILRHALNERQEADAAYQLALDKYRGAVTENDPPSERGSAADEVGADVPRAASGGVAAEDSSPELPAENTSPPARNGFEFEKGLRALCLADYGEYLMRIRSSRDAAKRFREADRVFGQEAPAAFRIFVLCREAGAWLQENRWANADERLDDARHLAERFEVDHHLPAFVYQNLAWARMIQWRIEDAEHWFTKSNQVLNESLVGSVPAGSRPTTVPADQRPSLEVSSDAELPVKQHRAGNQQASRGDENPFRIDPEFRDWGNIGAQVMYLHNLHGLAMVQRFQGRTELAAKQYRWLADEVNKSLTHVTQKTINAESNAEAKLYARLVNTLERLADCNLFGDPSERDLAEAIDDYRRALSRCHRIPNGRTVRAQLLYKQALALALPPDISDTNTQDTELALAVCQAADQIYQESYAPANASRQTGGQSESRSVANGMILALGELTTKVVTLITASHARDSADDTQFKQAVADLRQGVHAFREQHGPNLHRDQLEICLFSANVLLEHACEKDRFHLQDDGELLLSFCRLALAPDQGDERHATGGGETRAYLRPFYNTVMRRKLRVSDVAPKHVKDLLEVQFEATKGHEYMKKKEALPVLAFYVLDGTCYLLLDLPWGASRCYSLTDDYELDEIHRAANDDASRDDKPKLLPLPREVQKLLVQWRDGKSPQQDTVPLVCHWDDLVPRSNLAPWESDHAKDTVRVAKPETARFPFDLPPGFDRPAAETAPAGAAE